MILISLIKSRVTSFEHANNLEIEAQMDKKHNIRKKSCNRISSQQRARKREETYTMILNSLKSQWISPCSAIRTIKPSIVSKTISGFCNCFTCTLIYGENMVRMIYFYHKHNFKTTRNMEIIKGKRKKNNWRTSLENELTRHHQQYWWPKNTTNF